MSIKGNVLKSTGKWYTVELMDGSVVSSRIRGKIRLEGLRTTNPIAVGDVVDVVSAVRGKQGKARIDSVGQQTGKVTFTLLDGGTGYRLTTSPVVAEKMIAYSNKVFSNTYIPNFLIDETVYQPLANIVFSSSNTSFSLTQQQQTLLPIL